ncbi:MAG: SDR family oxidoreductase [Thermoplasmata archaeon]|nr:SDR family oxidoreductase [Thermoplasmata archaeon]
MLAEHLQTSGYRVVGVARSAPSTSEAIPRSGDGSNIVWITGDVADAASVGQVVERVRSFGRLDLLVNNASDLGPSPLVELNQLSTATLRRILEVNLLAPLELARELYPFLRTARGLVVNISSDAAVAGYPRWGGYGASKAALDLATRTLAAESGAEGVTFVSVDPGDMRTAMHQAAFPGEDISDRPLPESTRPFWVWLLGQRFERINGGRFRAQAETWELPPLLA